MKIKLELDLPDFEVHGDHNGDAGMLSEIILDKVVKAVAVQQSVIIDQYRIRLKEVVSSSKDKLLMEFDEQISKAVEDFKTTLAERLNEFEKQLKR